MLNYNRETRIMLNRASQVNHKESRFLSPFNLYESNYLFERDNACKSRVDARTLSSDHGVCILLSKARQNCA